MKDIKPVLSTLEYVKKLSGTALLVKMGGSTLKNIEEPNWVCKDLEILRSVGVSVVLVHGGGPLINAELKARGITWEFLDGQRITTPEMMKVIEMVLYGTVNRQIVRSLNLSGVPAVGISGVESSTLLCKTAPALGKVGVIEHVDTSLIQSIMKTMARDGKGAIPVIAPIGISEKGDTVNINADWVASRVAQFLGIKKMVMLTDQDGILDKSGKVIGEMDASELDMLIESGVVQGGMLTKARTILNAIGNGVESVHVINGNREHSLLEELFTDNGAGTVCRRRSRITNEVSND